jgi:hypothetical protein
LVREFWEATSVIYKPASRLPKICELVRRQAFSVVRKRTFEDMKKNLKEITNIFMYCVTFPNLGLNNHTSSGQI